jgi:hypothetical protein
MTTDDIKALVKQLRECSWARATISPELKPQWTGDDAPERAADALESLQSQLLAKTALANLYAASLRQSEAEVEGLKVDAERWRTEMALRNDPAVAIMFVGTHNRCSIFRRGELLASGETYAEAIDAAQVRGEEEKPHG